MNPVEAWRSNFGVASSSGNLTTWTGRVAGTVLTPSGSTWTVVSPDSTFNGQPSIKNTSNNQNLSSTLTLASQPNTILLTLIVDTGGPSIPNIIDNSSGGTTAHPRQILQIQTGIFWIYGGTSDLTTGVTASVSTKYRLAAMFNGASSAVRANGTTGTVAATIGTDALGTFSIGESSTGGSSLHSFVGRIVDIAIYSRILSTTELALYEAWSTAFYGA
jgi:hypothetical protein